MRLQRPFRRRRRLPSAAWLSTDGRAEDLPSAWVDDVEVSADQAPASWLSGALDTPWRDGVVTVGAVIPAGFDAYLRIDHPPTDDREGGLPPAVAQRLVRVLAGATTTPDTCWMAVWNGWGGMPAAQAVIHLPGRDYVLLSGDVEAAGRPLWSYGGYQSPSLWWTDDRAWCVATEVDFAWTYVGCLETVAEVLRRDAALSARVVRLADDANA